MAQAEQQQQKQKRVIFVRDDEKSKFGFTRHEDALKVSEGIPETETQRVRVRFRNRNGTWDVVVKARREVA